MPIDSLLKFMLLLKLDSYEEKRFILKLANKLKLEILKDLCLQRKVFEYYLGHHPQL